MTTPRVPAGSLDRRRFLVAVGGAASAAAVTQLPGRAQAATAPIGDPFTLGVASGDPTPNGFVLWTRLAPQPFVPGSGMPAREVLVEWQIARDENMTRILRTGVARALPQLNHSVHVSLEGLAPGRDYYYRFRYAGHLSPVGRTRTTPDRHVDVQELSFAFASCQAWSDGYYPAYRHMAQDDLDLVLHLGDYVYEGDVPADGGLREVPVPEQLQPAPRTLDEWRLRYALYKSDPDLQLVHQSFPWLVTWDDHEVQNDYAGHLSQYEGDISALRSAAYQAWYENQPVRRRTNGNGRGPKIYSRRQWGRIAQFDMLDGRQYRDAPPCGWGEAQACAEAYDPAISMLGREQESWLGQGLRSSTAQWNVLGNNVMMARLDHDGEAGDLLWNDAWDGFPAARNRLTDQIVSAGIRNPVLVTGDWHSTFVNDIKRDFDDADSPVVATEFVGTSISTNGDVPVYGPYYGPMIGFNPHIQFFDGDRRGYVRCTLDREQWRTDLQMVGTVSTPDAPVGTLASFVVEDGVPGAVRV